MKKLILSLVATATVAMSTFAQAPEAFKYQSVVRDASGNILGSQAVGMQLTILQGSATGTAVYTETFAATSNGYGLVNLEIGTGTTSDDFTAIDWSNGPYFMETAADLTGGISYVAMGTSQLLSVPYALYAKSAETVTNDLVDDADADPTNELNTTVVLNGTDLEVTDAGGTIITDLSSLVDDADADPTNELQQLSLAGTTLSISNGNNVSIPGGDITEVIAGDGLTGGGSTGSVTLTAAANNGLNVDATADAIQLGGNLTENTTITHGTYNLIHNLSSTGDFVVQDAGTNHFEVRDNGLTYFGDDTYWNDASTTGTTIASLTDDVNDGRFQLFENGITSVDLDANSFFVFNEQGLDRDFRIESDDNPNMFRLDANNNRIGLGTSVPQATLHVSTGAIMPTVGTGANGITFPTDPFGGSGDEASIQLYAVSGETSDLRISNQNDWDDKISFFQSGGERLTVYDSNVGIEMITPAYRLHLGTNSAAKPTSSVWTITSDRRLKKDIKPYTKGLDDLLKIEPVWFTYNGKADMPLETGVGVIAQDLEKIAPYMISTWEHKDENGTATEYLGVDNGAMTYMLINAVKEQQEVIDSQKSEMDELRKMVMELNSKVEQLEDK